MSALVVINGQRHDKLNATISILDHGLLYGDGVSVGLRIEAGQPRQAQAQCQRFLDAAAQSRIPIHCKLDDLLSQIVQAVAETKRTTGYVRLIATRGAGTLGPDPRKCEPNLIFIIDDYVPYPPEVARGGLHVIVCQKAVRRAGYLEDLGLLLANSLAVTAFQEALALGCFDAIVRNEHGELTGSIDATLCLVHGDELTTPPKFWSPDPNAALELHEVFAIRERPLGLADLATADEICLLSTAAGVVPVVRVDAQPVGPGVVGPVVSRLQNQYRELCSLQ